MKLLKTLTIISLVSHWSLTIPDSFAKGDMSQQKPINIRVFLGDKSNPYQFIPAQLQFETGRLYRLKLTNQSKQKHYFTSNAFAASIYTRKVQVIDEMGATLAEVKGVIQTMEVYPGQTAEWWFVPVKTGTFTDLHCQINGHAKAGMVGKIIIK